MSVAVSEIAPTPPPAHAVAGAIPTDCLRIGLVGFGRTGRDVASLLLRDPEMRLEWVVRRTDEAESREARALLDVACDDPGRIHSARDITADELLSTYPVDAIIDFSSDAGIEYYGPAAAEHGVAIVTAISHYSESRQRDLRRLAVSTRVLWSPNITLGINFLLLAAQSLQRIAPHVDVEITEEHFRDKAGVSGTALRLARALSVPDDAVHSVRAGGIIGVHEVLFGFPAQTIRLRHEAISREAFGHGAAFAARQLVGRERGYYRMEDLLVPYFAMHETVGLEPSPRRGLRGRLASKLRAAAQRLD